MRRRPFLTLVGAAVATGGCVGGPAGSVRTGAGREATSAATKRPASTDALVEMSGSTRSNYGGNYWFDPVGLHVQPGTTVTWRSGQGAPHTATAYRDRVPAGVEPFSSPHLPDGLTFEHEFEVEGVYDYYCVPHRATGMVGRVVCGEPSDEPVQPPDGAVPTVERIVADGRVGIAEF